MYHTKLFAVLLIISAALCLCNGASLYPTSLSTEKGSVSTKDLSALQTKDQSGSQDTWNNYVEFDGSSTAYKGTFTFAVSNTDSVASYTLNVNFKGPKYSAQVWQFEWFVPASNTWILAGDNSAASSWKWSTLSFVGTSAFSSLVSGGVAKLRFSSKTATDNCDIDFVELAITSGSASTDAPATVPTDAPTAAPTSAPTTKPTAAATTKPTAAPTAAPTTAPTTKPTTAPTTKPTTAPTTKPTTAPTTAPTTKPTTAPTTKPTAAPTTKPTAAPTTKPTTAPASPDGRICPAGQVWAPTTGTSWQWQLTGTIDQSLDVQMYDIDLFDNTAATISSLHAKGRVVICYFSTQYEDWRSDAAKFTSSILGSNLDDWVGERYVDIRSSVLRTIMTDRLDLAVSKGCDGVEPDNVDSYANSNGLGITAADQINFNKFIASEAHKRGLSVGLKNDLDQVSALVSYYDWALNEQCNQYGECDSLTPFVDAGKAVFGVEYSGTAAKVCPTMVSDKMSWLMKKLALDASGTQCCTYASGGCAAKAHTCIDYNAISKRSIEESEPIVVAEVENAEVDSAASASFPAVAVFVVVSALALVL